MNFDTPVTWCKLSPKLLRSYALDALDRRPHKKDDAIAVDGTRYIASIVESEGTAFRATGEGEDVRLGGDKMAGAAPTTLTRLTTCMHVKPRVLMPF